MGVSVFSEDSSRTIAVRLFSFTVPGHRGATLFVGTRDILPMSLEFTGKTTLTDKQVNDLQAAVSLSLSEPSLCAHLKAPFTPRMVGAQCPVGFIGALNSQGMVVLLDDYVQLRESPFFGSETVVLKVSKFTGSFKLAGKLFVLRDKVLLPVSSTNELDVKEYPLDTCVRTLDKKLPVSLRVVALSPDLKRLKIQRASESIPATDSSCALCSTVGEDTFLGPMVAYEKLAGGKSRSVVVHLFCAKYTSYGILGGPTCNIVDRVKQCRSVKCHICSKKGASIGCFNSSDMNAYHLPCLLKSQWGPCIAKGCTLSSIDPCQELCKPVWDLQHVSKHGWVVGYDGADADNSSDLIVYWDTNGYEKVPLYAVGLSFALPASLSNVNEIEPGMRIELTGGEDDWIFVVSVVVLPTDPDTTPSLKPVKSAKRSEISPLKLRKYVSPVKQPKDSSKPESTPGLPRVRTKQESYDTPNQKRGNPDTPKEKVVPLLPTSSVVLQPPTKVYSAPQPAVSSTPPVNFAASDDLTLHLPPEVVPDEVSPPKVALPKPPQSLSPSLSRTHHLDRTTTSPKVSLSKNWTTPSVKPAIQDLSMKASSSIHPPVRSLPLPPKRKKSPIGPSSARKRVAVAAVVPEINQTQKLSNVEDNAAPQRTSHQLTSESLASMYSLIQSLHNAGALVSHTPGGFDLQLCLGELKKIGSAEGSVNLHILKSMMLKLQNHIAESSNIARGCIARLSVLSSLSSNAQSSEMSRAAVLKKVSVLDERIRNLELSLASLRQERLVLINSINTLSGTTTMSTLSQTSVEYHQANLGMLNNFMNKLVHFMTLL